MKIAVIGSGIAGMGAALALSEVADVTLIEKDSRFGGHANTVEVDGQPVDTGFIVYNHANYPHLTSLFEHLDVPTRASDMSFGMSVNGGRTEYACDNVWKVFAQPLNILSPRFVGGVREILRFHREAQSDLVEGRLEGLSLGQYLEAGGYGDWLRDCFLLPMGGAIWSTPTGDMLDFPAENFVHFFKNHQLLNGNGPGHRWRTVDGGSREYVRRLIGRLPTAVAGIGVAEIRRPGGRPLVRFTDGSEASFDQVVLASHAPQSRAIIADLDAEERDVLSSFQTSRNIAWLHSDPALMPKRKRVWSSWNFLSDGNDTDRPAPITYWMNRLQGIEGRDYFVSLNPAQPPERAHARFEYAHPLFTQAAFDAQGRMDTIQGRGGVWYAGAWLGYGFHEDGLRAGLRVAAALGATPSWAGEPIEPMATPLAAAAE
ncbi:NAD(P)/FAD-dependent oxidoreductase [Pontivivens ytuae]|uniref:FAD-dependent oxidoreductase n=1 Tax=Pontivivens ytuae TaxID=2789856 RepID=A0A7S9QBT1_9RHOB|nr:FAD-dependent oxidoreductase [Pontivivens ytuae]QPH53493.1 FAD-dependent oxidoreductase [Pontivivens ytuae]